MVNLLYFYGLVRSGPDSVTVCVGVYRWTWWLAFWCLINWFREMGSWIRN